MDKKKLEKLVNDLAINGQLPLPYFKSKIIEQKANMINSRSHSKEIVVSSLNKKYKQIKVASGSFGRLNTKIYDLY